MPYSKKGLKKKIAKLERKYYSKYVLKFDIGTLLNILAFDIHTSLNILEVRILNLGTLSEVHISNSSMLS